MEPMMMGSPPSSPASPGINQNFLPNFLIGDLQQPNSPVTATSPGRNKLSSSSFRINTSNVNVNTSEPRTMRHQLFNQSFNDSPAPQPQFVVSEKAGPPKLGLFDTIDQVKKSTTPVMSNTVAQNESVHFSENISKVHLEESLNYSRQAALNDSVNMSRTHQQFGQKIDTHWVTVFGFPPSALTVVLAQLSNCGVISDKRIPTQGNWVHVKFNNHSEVARALSLNGKIINNSIMIGIQPYHIKENKENDSTFGTPSRARSLRHSFVSPSSSSSVVSPTAVPQKSTGLVTKAMEYVFGW